MQSQMLPAVVCLQDILRMQLSEGAELIRVGAHLNCSRTLAEQLYSSS